MTVTYNPALLTDLDRMRNILGDVNLDAPYAEDETYIARLLEASGSWKLAAAAMARSFAAQAINQVSSFSTGSDLAVSWSSRADSWLKIAQSLEQDAARDRETDDSTTSGWWSAKVTRSDRRVRSEYARPIDMLED